MTALPVVDVVDDVGVVGSPLHLELGAVWFAKLAGWSGYTTGMAGETSLRLDRWRFLLLLSQHVGSGCFFFVFFYFILFFLFPCTFSIPIITSSMIMMSGRF